MRDLLPTLPVLGAVPLLAVRPTSLVDMRGLVADVERRFGLLEAYCAAAGDLPFRDPEFCRLDAKVAEAVEAVAAAPARDLIGMLAKARALMSCPAIHEDYERSDRVGRSLALDVLRLLAGTPS